MGEVETIPSTVVVIVLSRTMGNAGRLLLFPLAVLRFSFSTPVSISVAHMSSIVIGPV
jgi:hypothetical protein